ncbi:MAG: efflux RND transporter permease subunit [Acidobacteria bacterium]|nr:MAG: efflux RND transporter permease subunit [Acidobacteriota bacterium]
MNKSEIGIAGRVARYFINSKLTPLLMVFAVLMGVFAIYETPREEDPQIVVPMMDVFVGMPGSSAEEVEQRVTTPMERLIWEIPGVDYVYSMSYTGQSMVIVRFKVGENEEASIVKLYNKLYSNFDLIPPGATQPLIKPRTIYDVPVLALTFWSNRYDDYQIRRVAAEVDREVQTVQDVSVTQILGGQKREIRVMLSPAKMAAHGVAPAAIVPILNMTNQELPSGGFASGNREYRVETGDFLRTADDVGKVVIGVSHGRAIYLRDISTVVDGPAEPSSYVLFGFGKAGKGTGPSIAGEFPAVTLSVSKLKGTNAAATADEVLKMVNKLKGTVIPKDVNLTVTRNYGQSAEDKSNELLEHLLIATLSVTLLIALALGWRPSIVVLAAVPVTLALALFVFYIYGYTLNRVTLFALIFSIGILVDDAIVVVENIARHFHLPQNKGRPLVDVAVEAVDEVGNPTILATFTVIAAVFPMAFVQGLMGPYMRPIPIGASMAMIFSMLVAFVVSPWAALRVLVHRKPDGHEGEAAGPDRLQKIYRRVVTPLIKDSRKRLYFLGGVILLLLLVMVMPLAKLVLVKMLPFDNKSEFQVIVDMPEGTTLEQTALVTRAVARRIAEEPEVVNYVEYIGIAAPYDFNGLVRHYFLREGPNKAEIYVDLLPKSGRETQSHDIAKRVRLAIDPIGAKYAAKLKVAEIPPGPPVMATLVAEVYGPDSSGQIAVARQILDDFKKTPGVVDVDWSVEAPQRKLRFVVDKQKAALNEVSAEQIAQTLRLALHGSVVGIAHLPNEREDVNIFLQVPRAERSSANSLGEIQVASRNGTLVPLSELTDVKEETIEQTIYHKNLKPVVYVMGDVAGHEESPVYAMIRLAKELDKIKAPGGTSVERYLTQQPFLANNYSMKWDGEWQITYEVFRDLGFAFLVALILIYGIVVGWFQSFIVPLVIMAPIPLTLVGILPAHALMGAFFTATSIIGVIALAGIIVRNSILVVDFIELRLAQGMPLEESVVDAGAVRFRPILLTAAAVVVGALVILSDPIFRGLAIALIAGAVASTLLSQIAVPVLYYLTARRKHEAAKQKEPAGGRNDIS